MDGLRMKKVRKSKDIYDKYLTMNNLYKMWDIVKKTCKNKREVFYFSLNLNCNLMDIYNDLRNRKYIPGKYRPFMIFEPKARLVMSQSIRDKIVNHFVTNYYLIPYLENSLINENVATRKGRGSSYAMNLLKSYFNKFMINNRDMEVYVLKIDISKYFYTIDHNILINKISNKIKDKDVINLVSLIINETNKDYINNLVNYYNNKYKVDIPMYKNNKGLSIGAMSSQFLAIYYLNNIDHLIKEKYKCKYYIRYMDDFLIMDTDKRKLKYIWKEIDNEIKKLNLKTNSKSNIYRSSKGFNFLGYKYKYINNKVLVSCNKKTYYKICKKLRYLRDSNIIKYKRSCASYYGYFRNVYKLDKYNFKITLNDIYNSYNNCLLFVRNRNYYMFLYDGILYNYDFVIFDMIIDRNRNFGVYSNTLSIIP